MCVIVMSSGIIVGITVIQVLTDRIKMFEIQSKFIMGLITINVTVKMITC